MAFSAANLHHIGGYPGRGALYAYLSNTDDREDIMASGYFNNTDDVLNLTADDIILVIGDEGFYSLRVDTVSSGTVTTEAAFASSIWLQVTIEDLSAATSHWTVAPCDGKIRRMKSVVNSTVSDATTLGLELGGTNVTDGASADIITIAAGGAAGDVDTGEADTANTVAENDAIELTCGGEGSTSATDAEVLIEIVPA